VTEPSHIKKGGKVFSRGYLLESGALTWEGFPKNAKSDANSWKSAMPGEGEKLGVEVWSL